jgi:hypothetical protein
MKPDIALPARPVPAVALVALLLAAGGCATAPPPYEQFYVSEERDPPCAHEVLQELRLETELGDRRREGAILDALEDDLRRAIRSRGGSGIIGLRYDETADGHVSVTGTIIRFTDLDCAHREQQARTRRAAAERR